MKVVLIGTHIAAEEQSSFVEKVNDAMKISWCSFLPFLVRSFSSMLVAIHFAASDPTAPLLCVTSSYALHVNNDIRLDKRLYRSVQNCRLPVSIDK